MLSRVADSLYWMSRYFERADNASRVLKATYGLILNPAKFSTEERWFRAVSSLAPGAAASNVDPQRALFLVGGRSGRSFFGCEVHRRAPAKMPARFARKSVRKCGST